MLELKYFHESRYICTKLERNFILLIMEFNGTLTRYVLIRFVRDSCYGPRNLMPLVFAVHASTFVIFQDFD